MPLQRSSWQIAASRSAAARAATSARGSSSGRGATHSGRSRAAAPRRQRSRRRPDRIALQPAPFPAPSCAEACGSACCGLEWTAPAEQARVSGQQRSWCQRGDEADDRVGSGSQWSPRPAAGGSGMLCSVAGRGRRGARGARSGCARRHHRHSGRRLGNRQPRRHRVRELERLPERISLRSTPLFRSIQQRYAPKPASAVERQRTDRVRVEITDAAARRSMTGLGSSGRFRYVVPAARMT